MNRQVIKVTGSQSLAGVEEREQGDVYMDRLLKLIPAESVTVYMFLDGVLRSALDGNALRVWSWIVFGIVLTGNILYLKKSNIKDFVQYVIMELALVVWVIGLGGPFALYSWYQPFIGSIALGVFTFLFAKFYKGISA